MTLKKVNILLATNLAYCKLLIFNLLIFLNNSCTENTLIINKIYTLKDEIWHRDSTLNFKFTIVDTSSVYNIFLYLKITNSYPKRNLYIFATYAFPNGDNFRDTINCILADERGYFYGTSLLGLNFENLFLIKQQKLNQKGVYKLKLEQGLRTVVIKGIKNVGIRIEKVK